MLKLFVLLGVAAFLALLPILLLAFISIIKFNQHLSLKYPGMARINAWQTGRLAAPDDELNKKAKKVKLAIVLLMLAFVLMLLSGLAISVIGV
jgi:hypothetical protein